MEDNLVDEAKQDAGFLDEIAAAPEGAGLLSCIQCGTCSGTCPLASVQQHSPRKVFAMIRAGMKEEVLRSNTPWVCSSCYECTVKCPAQIKITEIMYALRRMAVREGAVSRDSDTERFDSLFTDSVGKYGRVHELGLMMKYMLFHHTFELLRQMPVGLQMLRSGRMPILPHKIKDQHALKNIVARAIELEEEGSP